MEPPQPRSITSGIHSAQSTYLRSSRPRRGGTDCFAAKPPQHSHCQYLKSGGCWRSATGFDFKGIRAAWASNLHKLGSERIAGPADRVDAYLGCNICCKQAKWGGVAEFLLVCWSMENGGSIWATNVQIYFNIYRFICSICCQIGLLRKRLLMSVHQHGNKITVISAITPKVPLCSQFNTAVLSCHYMQSAFVFECSFIAGNAKNMKYNESVAVAS